MTIASREILKRQDENRLEKNMLDRARRGYGRIARRTGDPQAAMLSARVGNDMRILGYNPGGITSADQARSTAADQLGDEEVFAAWRRSVLSGDGSGGTGQGGAGGAAGAAPPASPLVRGSIVSVGGSAYDYGRTGARPENRGRVTGKPIFASGPQRFIPDADTPPAAATGVAAEQDPSQPYSQPSIGSGAAAPKVGGDGIPSPAASTVSEANGGGGFSNPGMSPRAIEINKNIRDHIEKRRRINQGMVGRPQDITAEPESLARRQPRAPQLDPSTPTLNAAIEAQARGNVSEFDVSEFLRQRALARLPKINQDEEERLVGAREEAYSNLARSKAALERGQAEREIERIQRERQMGAFREWNEADNARWDQIQELGVASDAIPLTGNFFAGQRPTDPRRYKSLTDRIRALHAAATPPPRR